MASGPITSWEIDGETAQLHLSFWKSIVFPGSQSNRSHDFWLTWVTDFLPEQSKPSQNSHRGKINPNLREREENLGSKMVANPWKFEWLPSRKVGRGVVWGLGIVVSFPTTNGRLLLLALAKTVFFHVFSSISSLLYLHPSSNIKQKENWAYIHKV